MVHGARYILMTHREIVHYNRDLYLTIDVNKYFVYFCRRVGMHSTCKGGL